MGKYVVRLAEGDERGVVLDADTVERWVEAVDRGNDQGELASGARYVAGRLTELLGIEQDPNEETNNHEAQGGSHGLPRS